MPLVCLLSVWSRTTSPGESRIGVSRPIFSRLGRGRFRLVFFLYQLLAVTLTIFAFIRYVWQPLGFQPWALYLPLTLLIVLAAAVLLGEEFDITRIRYSHGVMAVILFGGSLLVAGDSDFGRARRRLPFQGSPPMTWPIGATPFRSASAFSWVPGSTYSSGNAPSRCTASEFP